MLGYEILEMKKMIIFLKLFKKKFHKKVFN